MLQYCVNEASKWPQIYQRDPNFTTTYQLLGTVVTVINFHIPNGLLCHMVCLYVLASENENMIWEVQYSRVARHFGVDKTMVIL
jgi:hypothetical protein